MKAYLKNYRQAPRKVRLVADLIRGKKVGDAMAELSFLPKRASEPMRKLVESAVSNATHNEGKNKEDLYIKNIEVNKGLVMKRYIPGARGRAYPIKKFMSHIAVELSDAPIKTKSKKVSSNKSDSTAPKAEKKASPKKSSTKEETKAKK